MLKYLMRNSSREETGPTAQVHKISRQYHLPSSTALLLKIHVQSTMYKRNLNPVFANV